MYTFYIGPWEALYIHCLGASLSDWGEIAHELYAEHLRGTGFVSICGWVKVYALSVYKWRGLIDVASAKFALKTAELFLLKVSSL